MQAVLNKTGEIRDIKSRLNSLFDMLDNANHSEKSSIENEIVDYGFDAVDYLVDKLISFKGSRRGVAAMSLIRIGEVAIPSLCSLAQGNKNSAWIANYIIKEIQGAY